VLSLNFKEVVRIEKEKRKKSEVRGREGRKKQQAQLLPREDAPIS